MIRAFLFDYDGVISAGSDDYSTAKNLAKNLGISTEKAAELIVGIWEEFSTGKLTEEETWQKMEAHYGKPIPPEKRNIWYTWEEIKPLPQMLELVRSLKSKGYRVGLLSNVIPPTAALIRQNGGYNEFDFVVLSCEVGARKPTPEIFESAWKHLEGITPEEVMYLDDREHLTTAARELGINSLYVTNHADAIKYVEQLIGR